MRHVTQAELRKQEIMERNLTKRAAAKVCMRVYLCVFCHCANTVTVLLLCHFIVIHTKSVSYFQKRFMKFWTGAAKRYAIERAVCQGGLVLCGLVTYCCCNKPFSYSLILQKCVFFPPHYPHSSVFLSSICSLMSWKYIFVFAQNKQSWSLALRVSFSTNSCEECLTNILLKQARDCVGRR